MKPAALVSKLKTWQGSRTAEQAAEELGISRRTYEAWRAGRNRPRGLGLTTLLALVNPPKPKPARNHTNTNGARQKGSRK